QRVSNAESQLPHGDHLLGSVWPLICCLPNLPNARITYGGGVRRCRGLQLSHGEVRRQDRRGSLDREPRAVLERARLSGIRRRGDRQRPRKPRAFHRRLDPVHDRHVVGVARALEPVMASCIVEYVTAGMVDLCSYATVSVVAIANRHGLGMIPLCATGGYACANWANGLARSSLHGLRACVLRGRRTW